MTKVNLYREKLKSLSDWDNYLLSESGLPGPRGNLELAAAVTQEGNENLFRRYAGLDPFLSRTGTAEEFLVFCGVMGYGRLLADGNQKILCDLMNFSNDSRWRIREAAAIGLQIFGDKNMDTLLQILEPWINTGSLLEKRAVAAALCEPRLLSKPEYTKHVLQILDKITNQLLKYPDRKAESFRVLRQALGYCWSVAIAALPDGFAYLEKWVSCKDPDVTWIIRENLKKKRLIKANPVKAQALLTQI